VRNLHAAVLPLPGIQGLPAHAEPAAQLAHVRACLRLLDRSDLLLLREPALAHDSSALGAPESDYKWIRLRGPAHADIIKTCRVLFGGWHRPNSVDWLIYCIERTTSISPPPGYPNDFPYVSAYSESAAEPGGSPPTGWSAAAIRDNWEWNL